MARTKEFDPDAALEIAVEVFWRLGYEHTSLDTLMREMGISRQSLYDTFGDKRSIYFKAMSRYRDKTNGDLKDLLTHEKPVRKACDSLFQSIIRESRAQHERGCLLMNANLSRSVDDVEIKAFLRDNQKDVERIFTTAFVEAKKRGELAPEKDPVALSKFFVATIQGMRALARLNHDRKELAHVAAVALAALD
ncbi:TetR/AcrR family transcriptional regulator [Tunturibacter empetritectus]|uniref:AcrR family transcriptional regulator n=1 Tax=Tunturiibacter lichenicola TaxID=2051959 RepID=A0A7W8J6J1_9BACT|nr:TetR/AcrR family transcriptional regulator [Edaphobacter lichenicola]MBB5343560.1 AcrR family transcriptional regulator [Edaphobacter lichenicola]